eukprot:2620186-Pyramimonas_sp.AAC.1
MITSQHVTSDVTALRTLGRPCAHDDEAANSLRVVVNSLRVVVNSLRVVVNSLRVVVDSLRV